MVIVWREYYQNCSVLDCVTQCSQSIAHLYVSSSYRSNRLGLSHWDPYAVHRGGCLELYYCNMVEWFWWDSSLISTTNWFPSVPWHCCLVIRPVEIVPEMTYNVLSGTLSLYTTSTATVGCFTTSCPLTLQLEPFLMPLVFLSWLSRTHEQTTVDRQAFT